MALALAAWQHGSVAAWHDMIRIVVLWLYVPSVPSAESANHIVDHIA